MEMPRSPHPDIDFTTAAYRLVLPFAAFLDCMWKWLPSSIGVLWPFNVVRQIFPPEALSVDVFSRFTIADFTVAPMASASGIWGVPYELTIRYIYFHLSVDVDTPVQAMMMMLNKKYGPLSSKNSHLLQLLLPLVATSTHFPLLSCLH